MSRWRRRGAVILLLLGVGSLVWAGLLWRGAVLLERGDIESQKSRVYLSAMLGMAQVAAALAVLAGSTAALWAALLVAIAHGSLIAARCGAALTAGQYNPRQFLGPLIVLATAATIVVAMCRALEEEGSKPES